MANLVKENLDKISRKLTKLQATGARELKKRGPQIQKYVYKGKDILEGVGATVKSTALGIEKIATGKTSALDRGIETAVKGAGMVFKTLGTSPVKHPEHLTAFDKVILKGVGLHDEKGYRRMNMLGAGMVGAGMVGANIVGTAISNSQTASRGRTSKGDNIARLVSYDGTGFLNNANSIAGGDSEILNDMAQHAFTNQSTLGGANLGDIVFALHDSREG